MGLKSYIFLKIIKNYFKYKIFYLRKSPIKDGIHPKKNGTVRGHFEGFLNKINRLIRIIG